MKVKDVYFALNEIEQKICEMYSSEDYDEGKLGYLLNLKYRLLSSDLNDVESIESKVCVIKGWGKNITDIMKRINDENI